MQDTAGEHLFKLFKAIKHQVEKGPVDAVQVKAKYTLNDTGLLGDDVEYMQLVSETFCLWQNEPTLAQPHFYSVHVDVRINWKTYRYK